MGKYFQINSENRAACLAVLLQMTDSDGKELFPARPSGGYTVVTNCPCCGKRKLYADTSTGNMYCQADQKKYFPDTALADKLGIGIREATKRLEKALTGSEFSTEYKPKDYVEESPVVEDNVLNHVYHFIMAQLPKRMLCDYYKMPEGTMLVPDDREELLRRGFLPEELDSLHYFTYVKAKNMRKAEQNKWYEVTRLIATEAYNKYVKGLPKDGVPGLEKDQYHEGMWNMHQPASNSVGMPVRNRHNEIVRIMFRRSVTQEIWMTKTDLKDSPKCTWFTSGGRQGGCSSKSAIHYACKWELVNDGLRPYFEDGVAYVTEGVMKADLAHFIKPGMCFLAMPGVGQLRPLITELEWLKEEGIIKKVKVVFDMDYQDNPHVEKALNNLKEALKKLEIPASTYVWERYQDGEDLKGIDDLLAFKERHIKPSERKAWVEKLAEARRYQTALHNASKNKKDS